MQQDFIPFLSVLETTSWSRAESTFGKPLKEDVGLAEKGSPDQQIDQSLVVGLDGDIP
jgi:hypothetical protein